MRQELQQKLFDKYPKIFADKDKSIQETAMCWGIECGDGWYRLLDSLCDCIQQYIDYNDTSQIVASQVKEKYGGLRFYYDGGDELIDGMVWLAEHDSYNTCEQCGSTANVKQSEGGWIETRCDKCDEGA